MAPRDDGRLRPVMQSVELGRQTTRVTVTYLAVTAGLMVVFLGSVPGGSLLASARVAAVIALLAAAFGDWRLTRVSVVNVDGSLSVGRGWPRVVIAGAVLLSAPSTLHGQTVPPTGPAQASAAAVAVEVNLPPTLDGDVLDDPAWMGAPVISGFTQTQPNEGEAATESTEVRVVFSAETLYFGVVCYDRNPAAIIVSDSRRDSSLGDSDSFQLILDTFLDRQNGFVFGTSPAGQEYDGQVVNEGTGGSGLGGGGASSGGGGGFNLNWDGAWEVRTAISDIGWSAEFAIPFRTIRYPSGEAQIWGVNFQRSIRRRNELDYWAPLPRQYTLFRVSQAGRLTGVRVPPAAVRNLKLTPYILGEALRLDSDPDGTVERNGDFGADLKYSVTSGLTLDLTYNTDFAQIEVDQQQINLDRFNLYFPEKRPFFLENAGAFTVSNAGGAVRGDPGQTELFFSRRIGIAGGQPVPIVGGARLSGKVTSSVTVGLLNMQTDSLEGITPANNFTAARVRRDLPNRSSLGALFVNRQATGRRTGIDDYNRTFALDGRWGVGENGIVQGFVARTETPGLDGRDHAYSVSGEHSSQAWRFAGGFMESGDNFNPEVGYTRRVGFRKVDGGIFNTWRPEGLWRFQELTPHVTFNRFWDFDGFVETSFLHMHVMWQLEDSSQIGTALNVRGEGVKEPFDVSGVQVLPGRYDWNEGELSFNSNRSAPISFGVRSIVGGYFGGHLFEVEPSVRVRYGETLSVSVSWSRDDIDLPAGAVVTNLASTRVAYNFSPRLFVQSLIQYNDSAKLWSVNMRFGWLQVANTGLFVVYNATDGIMGTTPSGAGRSLVVKYSYMFDVLR